MTWPQALAWRLRRQLLEPVGDGSVADVVRRLGAIPAMDPRLAELAVGVRRSRSRFGDLAQAEAGGTVIRSFAFRGAVHHLSAEDGGAYLGLRTAGRQWELPSWQEFYDLRPADWPAFRETVREAVAVGPLTVAELGVAVTRHPRYRHLRQVFDEGAGTLIKPLTWQGDISFGPPRDGQHTFARLDRNPHWAGIWELDDAGPHAIRSYLRSYGPATFDHVHHWLGHGLSVPRKRLQGWLSELEGDLAAVEVEGETAYVVSEDVDALMSTRAADSVHLLPGHDQWVIGPGTEDRHVVPPARRTPVTRKANLVVAAGVVSGTWATRVDEVRVTWFAENGPAPADALQREVDGLSAFFGAPLRLELATA